MQECVLQNKSHNFLPETKYNMNKLYFTLIGYQNTPLPKGGRGLCKLQLDKS